MMKLSTIIQLLETLKAHYGDVESGLYVEDFGYDCEEECQSYDGIIIKKGTDEIISRFDGLEMNDEHRRRVTLL